MTGGERVCRLLSWPPREEDDILFRLETRQKRIWRYFWTKKGAKAQIGDSLRMKTLQKSNCRNMTGGERVVACYHGHLERKTIFLGLKRGK
jgi:hypothetical protein